MILVLILLGILSSSSSQSIHNMMTPEELLRIFGTLLAHKVPRYDTVPIVIKCPNKNNNGMYITLKPFGENLKMWLTPTDGILAGDQMPIYSIKSNNQDYTIKISKYSGYIKELLPKLYENTLHAATFAVNNHRDGKMSMTGFIGDSYIQPIPSRLMEHARRQAKAINITLNHEVDDHTYHIVHKIPNSRMKRQLALQVPSTPINYSQDIVYPEILVIVDYDLVLKFNGRAKEALLYILSFWNGVDMRYRNIEHPRIRLNIAGIVFSQDSNALSYLKSHEGKINNISQVLENKGIFLYYMKKLAPINSYDVAITMTSNSLCENNNCGILGKVMGIGKACDVDHQGKTVKKVLIMRDKAAFDGIETASHELGHLLGMQHDGTINQRCLGELGYIMATFNKFSQYAFEWSKCSLDDLENFLRSPQASCLFNKPEQGEPIHRFLPGQLMNADEQCKMLKGLKAAQIDDSICRQLKCQFPDNDVSKFTDLVPEAAEGTTCGIEKLCLHGNCIFKPLVNK